MPRRRESLGDALIKAPWPVAAVLGVIAFVVLRWVFPRVAQENKILGPLFRGAPTLAPVVLVAFAMLTVASLFFGERRKRLVDSQRSLETLRALSWKELELLVAEAYRRRGFAADFTDGSGVDGGIDVTLRREGMTSLVQCKHWRTLKVGAPIVRELLGVVTAVRATAGIVVTTGEFTREAIKFAEGQPLQLINGPALLELIRGVQGSRSPAAPAITEPANADPICPKCGARMVRRTARRGPEPGTVFWGCSAYPNCNGSRSI